MKHYILFTLLVCFACSLNAQFTQANHAPANGETYQMYQCDSTGITAGASGLNANWNYGTLNKHMGLLQSYTVSNVSSAQYPLANVATAASASNISYYRSRPDTLYYFGGNISVGAIAANLTYSSPALFAKYPMGYGSQVNAITGGSIVASQPFPANGIFTGSSNISVDGTGTLTLPGNKVFTSVSRIVTSQTINFNLLVPGYVIQNTYDFFAAGIKAPLLSIAASTLNTQLGGTSTQTLVFLNSASLITSLPLDNNVLTTVYPNPVHQLLNIHSDLPSAVQIFDLQGRCVFQNFISEGSNSISVKPLKPGMYTLVLNLQNGTQKQHKIIIAP